MAAEGKQAQVLNDLASFYVSNSNFDFTPPGSPLKVTPSTSDSEQDAQPEVEVQRNVFITSQDVTSRRRKGHPNSYRKQSTIGAALAPVEEVPSTRRRRTRHVAKTSSDSLSVGSSHSSRAPPRKTQSGNVLGANNSQCRSDVPLKDGISGSALETLKQRSASSERRRAAPGRSKSDDIVEMDRSRRSSSRSAGRRPRRRKTEGEVLMADDAARANESDAVQYDGEDFYDDGVGADRVVELSDPNELTSRGHRKAPGRSKSDDLVEMDRSRRSGSRDARRRDKRRSNHGDDIIADVTAESGAAKLDTEAQGDKGSSVDDALPSNHEIALKEPAESSSDHRQPLSGRSFATAEPDNSRGSSGERNRRRQRHHSSEDIAGDSAAGKDEGSGHRRASRHMEHNEQERSSAGLRRKPSNRREQTDARKEEALSDSGGDRTSSLVERDDSHDSDLLEKNKSTEASYSFDVDEQKEANSDEFPEPYSVSKWSGVKHGMAFINKTKAQMEEEKRTGNHPRRGHRRTMESCTSSPSSSSARDEVSYRTSSKGTNSHFEKSVQDVAEREGRPLKARGSSKWSVIKERSVSRSKSSDRAQMNGDAPLETSGRTEMSRGSSMLDVLSKSVAKVDENMVSKPPSQTQLTRSDSDSNLSAVEQPADSSLPVVKQTTQAALSDKTPQRHVEKDAETSSKPASTIFKNLLGKSMKKKKISGTTLSNDQIQGPNIPENHQADEALPARTGGQGGPKDGLNKLLKNSSITSDSGKSDKKGNRWGGLRSGVDFTSRLIKVAGDKKKQNHEGESSAEQHVAALGEDKHDAEPDQQKKGGLWNLSLGPGGSKADATDDVPLDYGLMTSVAGFSEDAMEDLANFRSEAISEGDENESSEDTNEVKLDMGTSEDGACANQERGCTHYTAESAAVMDGPDLLSVLEKALDTPNAFSFLKSSSEAQSSGPPDRRSMLVGLTAPSMRFEFDTKTETVVNHTQVDIIEEGTEDGDESDEETELSKKACVDSEEIETKIAKDMVHDNSSDGSCHSESESEGDAFLSPMKFVQLKFASNLTPPGELAVAIHSLEHAFDDHEIGDDIARVLRIRGIVSDNMSESNSTDNVISQEPVNAASPASGHSTCKTVYQSLRQELDASKIRIQNSRDAVHELQQAIQRQRQAYDDAERRRQEAKKEMQELKICLEMIGTS